MNRLSLYILTSTFILASCGGGGGGGGSSTPSAPTATVSLTASDTDLFPGDTTILTWSSTNATSCTASGDWSGNGDISGSQSVQISEGNNVFSLKCGDSSTVSVTVVGIISPTLSIEAFENINALEEVEYTVTINDPQNRYLSTDWSKTTTTGETVTYTYTNTTIKFSPPQQCNYQTISPTIVVTYDIANNNNGNTSSVEATTTSTIIPVIPDAPQNLTSVPGSQSAEFEWDASTGACSYSYYFAYDSGGLTKDSVKIDGPTVTEGSLVQIVNNRKAYFAVTATNVTGESELSNEINITTTSPSNEYTGMPNNQNANFSEIDYWGNVIGDYTNSLSTSAYCVKDNTTGMIWSIEKPTSTSAKHYSYGTYTYYDDTNVVNGINDFGVKNIDGTSCSFADDSNSNLNCNTQDYLLHLNDGLDEGEAYCGVEDWRIPTQDEAIQHFNLVDDGDYESDEILWTSSGMTQSAPANQIAVDINFGYPYKVFSEKSKSTLLNVRAVSSVDEVENESVGFTIECIEHDGGYSMSEIIDEASLISNQSGVDWTVPTLYELAHFKEKINESPGIEGQTYDVATTTPTIGTTNDTTFSLIRQSDGLLEVDSGTYGNGDTASNQMCFKGPVGATIAE